MIQEQRLVTDQDLGNGGGSEADKNQGEGSQTFAERVKSTQPECIDVDSLPSPAMNGEVPTVCFPQKALEIGKDFCKFALIGRLDFMKISILRARTIAQQTWSPSGEWKMIPLGNGFFMLKLNSQYECIKIWSQAWKFDNQVVRFTKLTPDSQKSSKFLLWVRFPKLKQQFWDYNC